MKHIKTVVLSAHIFLNFSTNPIQFDPNSNITTISDPSTDVDHVYLFAHGLAATRRQATSMFSYVTDEFSPSKYNQNWIVKNPLVIFDFPDAKNDEKIEWHGDKVNLGQDLDICTLASAFVKTKELFPNKPIVLGGVSRGAATILNYVGTAKPHNIAAIVLESPFDSLRSVILHLLRQYYISWIPFSEALAIKYMTSIFPLLNMEGISPIQVAHAIPTSIPILFVHSKEDKVVPISASRRLYVQLRQAGHNNVYLFELATGEHARLARGPEAGLYHQIVQSFYKKYGLPHETHAATFGDQILKYCQPAPDDVRKKLTHKKKKKIALEIKKNFLDVFLQYKTNTFLQVS